MNFKVNFEKPPTIPALGLVVSYLSLFCCFIWLICCFIDWNMPTFGFLRALFLVVLLVLIFAYTNKEQ